MSSPAPNANVPQIPTPLADVNSLAKVCQALKQGVDSLAGYRGNPLDRAVTFQDLATLKLISATTTIITAGPGSASTPTTTVVTPYVISGFAPAVAAGQQVILGHEFPIAVAFPGNFGPIAIGLYSSAGTFVAVSGSATITIEKCLAGADPTQSSSWAQVGTVSLTGHTGALSTGSAGVVFDRYDLLRARGPVTGSLSQFYLTLVGKR